MSTEEIDRGGHTSRVLVQFRRLWLNRLARDNPIMARFARSRRCANDRYRPRPFVSPEQPQRPEWALLLAGRWHMFYQAFPPEDPRLLGPCRQR